MEQIPAITLNLSSRGTELLKVNVATSLSGLEKRFKVAQSVVRRHSLCWWEMTSSTGLWLWSLEARIKNRSYWLVWLSPSLNTCLSMTFWRRTLLSCSPLFSLICFSRLGITAIKQTPRTLLTVGWGHMKMTAVISNQSGMQNVGRLEMLESNCTEVTEYYLTVQL